METNKVAIATRMGECTSYPLVWGGAVSIWNMHVATERITGECFLVEVDHRDEWKAYSRITATTGMSHETVNRYTHTGCGSDVELL